VPIVGVAILAIIIVLLSVKKKKKWLFLRKIIQ
jgi:LPXTG-motif cell wall-anchored protein